LGAEGWVIFLIGTWNNPVDLSQYRSISFYIRGEKTGFFSTKNDIRFRIYTVDLNVINIVKRKYEFHTAVYETDPIISPGKDWERVFISFNKLSLTQWYKNHHPEASKRINLSEVRQLGFIVYGGYGSNTVWIDDVKLER
jgi:hypothetical protein